MFIKKSQQCHWNKMTLPSCKSDDAAETKTIHSKKLMMCVENKMITSLNLWFKIVDLFSSKMTIKLLNSFKTAFVKRHTFFIIFQFTIVISILWRLLKHDRMIEKTMLIIQYTNLFTICSKLLYENEALTSENSMLINLILFFVFFYVVTGFTTRLYWNDEMTSWRRVVSVCWKDFSFWGFGLRLFFSFNSLIVSIVLPHGPTSYWCQIDVWDK